MVDALLFVIDYEHVPDLATANKLDAFIKAAYATGRISSNTARKARKRLNRVMYRLALTAAKLHPCSACNKQCDCGEDNIAICLECSICAGVADA